MSTVAETREISGFTLVEFLVVLGVIGLLAAILMPALSSSRAKARETVCLANEQQIGTALRLYLSDNDSCWPVDRTWRDGIRAYLSQGKGNLACPEAKDPDHPVDIEGIWGYAYNTALTGAAMASPRPAVSEPLVVYPSVTVAVCDEAVGLAVTFGPDPYRYTQRRPEGEERGWERHHGGANYLFCDSHTKWYPPEAVGYNTEMDGNNGARPSFALSGEAKQ